MEIFAFGGLVFWFVVSLSIVLLFFGTTKNSPLFCLFSLGAYLCYLYFLADVNIFTYIYTKPIAAVCVILSYFSLGCVWAIYKWFLFCKAKLNEYDVVFERFLEKADIPSGTRILTDDQKDLWLAYIRGNSHVLPHNFGVKPKIRDNKKETITWMACWPISVTLYIFGDLLVDLFAGIHKALYNSIEKTLQGVADSVWSTRSDIEMNKKKGH